MVDRFTHSPVITAAFTLGRIREITSRVKLRCDRCGRRGQYRVETLIQRYGADRKLPDLLNDIAQCPRLHALGNDGCGVYYAETPWETRRAQSAPEPDRPTPAFTRAYDRGSENH